MGNVKEIDLPAQTRVAKKYDKVANEIRKRITENAYSGILPGTKVLALEFGVSLMTANKAVKALESEGLVSRLSRKGTIINPLKTSRTKCIAIVVRDVSMPLTSRVVGQFELMARSSNLPLLFYQHFDDPQKECEIARELAESREVDGVIMVQVTAKEDQRAEELLSKAGIPVVALGLSPMVRCANITHKLRFDEENGFFRGTEFLIEKGHASISLIYPLSFKIKDYRACPRWQGYAKAMEHANLKPVEPVWFDETMPDQATSSLLRDIAPFSALFAHHDSFAVKLLPILYRNGINIPYSKSIISYDGAPISKDFDLTTMSLPMEEVALEAARIISDCSNNPRQGLRDRLFKTEIEVRGSVADIRKPA